MTLRPCMVCGKRKLFRARKKIPGTPSMHWLCWALNWPFRLYPDPW